MKNFSISKKFILMIKRTKWGIIEKNKLIEENDKGIKFNTF